MVKSCLMASHGYPPGPALFFHQDNNRVVRDCQPFRLNMVSGQETIWSNSLQLKPHQHEEIPTPVIGVELSNSFAKMDSTLGQPLFMNLKDAWPDKALFSTGLTEQCTRQDSIMQFLKCRWSELEAGGLCFSDVSEFMGLQWAVDVQNCSSQTTSIGEFDCANPLVDFVGDMARSSKITVRPDGRIILTATGTEIQDIFPIVAEFYLENCSTTWSKQSTLIPHFTRFDMYETEFASLKFRDAIVAPLNSPEKVKVKRCLKKRSSRRGNTERDLHKRNYFHACETLLSLLMNKKQNEKTAIQSLKRSGPELPELLTQFSAGIAGTGMAILFTVACKVASSTVPLCESKLLTTGVGIAMVWLSWAVNKLRDSIIQVSRNASKGIDNEEVMKTVDRSLKDVYFRGATLLVVAVLRVA